MVTREVRWSLQVIRCRQKHGIILQDVFNYERLIDTKRDEMSTRNYRSLPLPSQEEVNNNSVAVCIWVKKSVHQICSLCVLFQFTSQHQHIPCPSNSKALEGDACLALSPPTLEQLAMTQLQYVSLLLFYVVYIISFKFSISIFILLNVMPCSSILDWSIHSCH